MCFQLYEHFTTCHHINITDKKCYKAGDSPFFLLVSCEDYKLEERYISSYQCGRGRFYCKHGPQGTGLDELYGKLHWARCMTAWLLEQYKAACNLLDLIETIGNTHCISPAKQAEEEIMITAVREHRDKGVQLYKLSHAARQWARKAKALEEYHTVVVPSALQSGVPAPAIALPADEPYKAPAFLLRDIFPLVSQKPGDGPPRQYSASMQPALLTLTPKDDLDVPATSNWIKAGALDTMPIGKYSGDRSVAIHQVTLANLERRRLAGQQAAAAVTASDPDGKRRFSVGTYTSSASTSTALHLHGILKTAGKRGKRNVKRVNYAEQSPSSSTEKSIGSAFNQSDGSPTSSIHTNQATPTTRPTRTSNQAHCMTSTAVQVNTGPQEAARLHAAAILANHSDMMARYVQPSIAAPSSSTMPHLGSPFQCKFKMPASHVPCFDGNVTPPTQIDPTLLSLPIVSPEQMLRSNAPPLQRQQAADGNMITSEQMQRQDSGFVENSDISFPFNNLNDELLLQIEKQKFT